MNAPERPIGPTPERIAKAGQDFEVLTPDKSSHYTIRMLDGSPLSKLASIGIRTPSKGITGDQYYAGCRIFEDAYISGLVPSGVIDVSKIRVDCSGVPDIPISRIAAQTRYNHAIKAIDYDAYHIVSWVVVQGVPLNEYADRFREFPQSRERRAIALNLIRKALDQLITHYYPKARPSGITSAHIPDSRPVILPEIPS